MREGNNLQRFRTLSRLVTPLVMPGLFNDIPAELIRMIPFVVTIAALVLFQVPRTTRNGAAGAEIEQRGRARRQARSRPPAQPEESAQLLGRDLQDALERGHIRELSALRRIAHQHGAAAAYDAVTLHILSPPLTSGLEEAANFRKSRSQYAGHRVNAGLLLFQAFLTEANRSATVISL